MFNRTGLLTLAVCVIPVTGWADKVQPFLHTETLLHSEPITIEGALNEWQKGQYRGGKNQYGSVSVKAGVKKGDTSIAALYRQEYQASFSPDAADYYYGTQQHQLDANRQYQLTLKTGQFQARGLHLQQVFRPLDKLNVMLAGSLLQADHLQHGTLTGSATTTATGKDYDYNTNLTYQYDQDHLLDRPGVNTPSGVGYAVDVGVNWQPLPRWQVDVQAKDLLGEIHWDKAPYTEAQLTSDTKTTDSQGFTLIKPKVTGMEGYRDSFRQTLSPKLDGTVKYQMASATGDKAALLAVKRIPNETWWGVGGEMPDRQGGRWRATVWPEQDLLQVVYQRKHLSLSLGTNNPNLPKANTVWLGVEWH